MVDIADLDRICTSFSTMHMISCITLCRSSTSLRACSSVPHVFGEVPFLVLSQSIKSSLVHFLGFSLFFLNHLNHVYFVFQGEGNIFPIGLNPRYNDSVKVAHFWFYDRIYIMMLLVPTFLCSSYSYIFQVHAQ